MTEPFPELEQLLTHLMSDKVQDAMKLEHKIIMDIVLEYRFWETING